MNGSSGSGFDSEFDPLKTAAALELLEAELRDELHSEDAAEALALLWLELVAIATGARAWAERHGIPVDWIPEAPPASAKAEECLTLLWRLSGVLEQLGIQMLNSRNTLATSGDPHETMREVVQTLKRQRAEALLELQEFEYVLAAMLQHLEELRDVWLEVRAGVSSLASKKAGSHPRALCALEESAGRGAEMCDQLVTAFRQIGAAVKRWGVAET